MFEDMFNYLFNFILNNLSKYNQILIIQLKLIRLKTLQFYLN